MSKYVRVFIPESNKEITVRAEYAQAVGLQPLDKPAVNRRGNPLPEKVRVRLGEPAKKAPAGRVSAGELVVRKDESDEPANSEGHKEATK